MLGIKILPVIFAVVFLFNGCQRATENADYSDGNIISEWNHVLTETIIEDLFTPPVASRIYVYPNLAAYEVLKFTEPGKKSITANLPGFDAIPAPETKIHLTLAALKAFTAVAVSMVYNEKHLNDYYRQTVDSLRGKGMSEKQIGEAESFGKSVADKILKRASNDMFKKTRAMERYVLENKPGAWEPTPPDYMQGVEPNWKLIQPLVLDSCSVFCPDSILGFSQEKGSALFAAALEVKQVVDSLNSEQISIIKFWDDNPNVSSHFGHATFFQQKMTPGGHWMAIAAKAIKDKNSTQVDAAYTFALTSISLFDGFIACWQAKYMYSSIRPLTYIHKYIDSNWEPYLQTPPFPEYPSGHSTISAAAATVLTGLYGESYAFTDSSEVPFGLPVRSFTSFYHASDEAAVSRLYGGIHFRHGNEAGRVLGRKIGDAVLRKIHL
jgi:hypothetical protein